MTAEDPLIALAQATATALRFQEQLGLAGVAQAGDLRFRPANTAISRPANHAATPRSSAVASESVPAAAPTGTPGPTSSAGTPTASALEGAGEAAAEAGLKVLRSHIGDCTRCALHRGRTTIVFGVGDANARLMFVGEAPGRDEDLQGEPFVGKAGQLLDKMIVAMGLRRRDTYIANICKCRPPRNRDPEEDEVKACEPFLRRQIECVRPDVIVAMGRYASQALLRSSLPISRLRGQWQRYENTALMPTYHPAYLLRNPGAKKAVWGDLQLVMGRLGLQDPRKK